MLKPLPPVLFLCCLLAALGLHLLAPGRHWAPSLLAWSGVLPMLLGLGLLIHASGRFARIGTNIDTFRPPGVLVTDGVFAVTRNPMYLGFVLLLGGLCLLLGTATPWLPWLAFLAAARFWYIPFEERACSARFGPAYDDYRRRTRRWL